MYPGVENKCFLIVREKSNQYLSVNQNHKKQITMKTLFTSLTAASLLALASCGGGPKDQANVEPLKNDTLAADATKVAEPQETPPMDSAAMAKAWMEYSTPGDMQKWLAAQDGKWKGEMTSYGPNGESNGKEELTQENKMVMGGRYQESTVKGKMMGMDFEGKSLMGYDNAKKKFICSWVDNMGTGMMMTEGTYNEASKTLEMKGMMTDPTTGKDAPVRQVYGIIDDKTQTMEMYCEMDGKEMKTMDMKLVKK